MDPNYKPTAYLLREYAMNNGEPSSSITLDTTLSPDIMRELQDGTRLLAMTIFSRAKFKQRQLAPADHEYEILLGATANRLERYTDLLNDCRNLLIDLEGQPLGVGLAQVDQIRELLDEIDQEICP